MGTLMYWWCLTHDGCHILYDEEVCLLEAKGCNLVGPYKSSGEAAEHCPLAVNLDMWDSLMAGIALDPAGMY
jgi:hypothetical protein